MSENTIPATGLTRRDDASEERQRAQQLILSIALITEIIGASIALYSIFFK